MKSFAVFLLLGLSVLVGLFLWLRPAPVPAPLPEAAPTRVETPSPRVFSLQVQQGQRVAGPAVIRVMQGEAVVLELSADTDDELHLHGYDLSLAITAGQPARLAFTADRSGRFEYELHRAHREIGVLEVLPR